MTDRWVSPDGRITLIHGDCLEVLPSLEAGSVDAVVTDIPYAEASRASSGLRVLDKGAADIATFELREFLPLVDRVISGSVYMFCGFQQVSEIASFMRASGLSRRCIVWEKVNPSPMNGQSMWLSGVELCVFGRKSGATFNGHCRNTVLRYPCGQSNRHPTEKPVALFTDLVRTSTNEGDLVADPCAGSCTTAVACIRTNRRCICIEKERKYWEIGVQRVKAEYARTPLFAEAD